MDKNSLGYKIKYYRKKGKLSQTDLAKLIELKSSTVISEIENGHHYPHVDNLVKIAEVLQINPNLLAIDYLAKFNADYLNISDTLYELYDEISTANYSDLQTFMKIINGFIELKEDIDSEVT